MSTTPKSTDEILDGVAISQFIWTPGPLTAAAVEIVKAIMREPFCVYPDEVNLENIDADSRNCIGTAYRILAQHRIIEPTGAWKRSDSGASHGRKVFQYRLANVHFATEFLRRNIPSSTLGQQDLFKVDSASNINN